MPTGYLDAFLQFHCPFRRGRRDELLIIEGRKVAVGKSLDGVSPGLHPPGSPSSLVSLLESGEIEELGLSQQESICMNYGIDFANFPIADRNIPKDDSKVDLFIDLMCAKIEEGHSIVIHCRMGIGRSSIIAGCICLQSGQYTNVKGIVDRISSVRGLKVPDTENQVEWLKKREQRK
jgi:protein-tyrosine phosphatase